MGPTSRRLLAVLIDEVRGAGGPALDAATLRRFVMLYAAVMGTAWLLDVPSYLLRLLRNASLTGSIPESQTTSRRAVGC